MKGQAIITIKDKNGKIKKQVTEKNVVFDLPKILLKEMIAEADLGLGSNSGMGTSSYSGSASSSIDQLTCFEDWFRYIKVNDETCSEQDYKDWKMPVLFGGEVARTQSNKNRYAYYDTSNSAKTGNILKKSYTWNNCPAFTLKSINLCNFATAYAGNWNCMPAYFTNLYKLIKSGNFYWPQCTIKNGSIKGVYSSQLARKSTFDWTLDKGRRKFEKVLQVGSRQQYSSDGTYRSPAPITALKSNEIALLRATNDITTDNDTNSNDFSAKYLIIIDATTGVLKRSFPLTQFDGFIGYTSGGSSYAGTIYASYVRIIATDFGSFIVMSKSNNSASNLFIWKIPEQSEMENYSNNESIAVYADISSTGMTTGSGTFAINEFLFKPASSLANDLTIRINNDAQNPVTIYDYTPFNNNTSSSSYENDQAVFNKFYTLTPGTQGNTSLEAWYNTTVLNLSEGVAVAAGDTLTIEYTITAN